MRRITSISLVLMFVAAFAWPVFAADDCDMPCCQIQCCEVEMAKPECPVMSERQTTAPILLPAAPSPVTTKSSYFPIYSVILVSDLNSFDIPYSYLDNSRTSLKVYSEIPIYFLQHSLLI